MRLLSAIWHDIRFQFRHGFYYVYFFISLIYILILHLVPESVRDFAAVLVIFTDPAVLGFFFIGGIVLLEKGQNILERLFVTPLRIKEYFIAKLLSLTLIAVLASMGILVFTFGSGFKLLPLLIGVILSSLFYTLLGLALVARSKNLNQYIMVSPFVMIVFVLPIVEYLGLFKTPLFYLLPGKGSLVLLTAIFQDVPLTELLLAVVNLVVWIGIGYQWARCWFHKYIILKIGGGR